MMNAKKNHETRPRGGGLLHNMSVPPGTKIRFDMQTWPRKGRRGSRRVFKLPEDFPVRTSSAILRALGDPRKRIPKEKAEEDLRAKIDECARTFGLPLVAPVTDQVKGSATYCADLLKTVTVLAKSTGAVFLRAKEPNLARVKPGRRVVLVIPPAKGGKRR